VVTVPQGGTMGRGSLNLIEQGVAGIKLMVIYKVSAALFFTTLIMNCKKKVLHKEIFSFKQNVSNKIANIIYDSSRF
jgi:argininosuccinate synthase